MIADDDVERALVIVAHPDDVDFGAAGTVATWTDRGVDVAYCIVTDGEAGGSEHGVARAEMPSIRRAEQTEAAKVVGVRELYFLGHPDGRVVSSLELRRDLARVVRTVRPQRVITQSPERNYDRIYASHPDHLAVGDAALSAVYPDARNPWAHPELLEEGLDAHVVAEVWIMSATSPNRFVDTTDAIERKIDALRSHRSQIADPDAIAELIRSWGAAVASLGGLPDGRCAEGFRVVDTG
jgi:LmbE family N-acetylglucosaminyl deacetylase